ncbi:hypothetical protein ES705_46369 [subsurface metagenome]
MKTRLKTSFALRLRSGPSAFTLVELLVVVAIMMLAVGALLPALGGFFDSARAPDARNRISAHLAGARNYAVANNVTTALVFVEHNDGDLDRTLMFLAESSDGLNFAPVAGRQATHLPNNIMLTDNPTETIAICFLPAGQLTTLAITSIDLPNPLSGTINANIVEVTELDIYDYVVSDENPEEHLYINYYTGAVIEQ